MPLAGMPGMAAVSYTHLDVYKRQVTDIFVEETVLSHDILEGSFLRTCYVSDIEFLDSFPPTASAYFKRQHRWVRDNGGR